MTYLHCICGAVLDEPLDEGDFLLAHLRQAMSNNEQWTLEEQPWSSFLPLAQDWLPGDPKVRWTSTRNENENNACRACVRDSKENLLKDYAEGLSWCANADISVVLCLEK